MRVIVLPQGVLSGNSISTSIPLGVGENRVTARLSRIIWPTGSGIVRIILQASFDSGQSWRDIARCASDGGISRRRDGVEQTQTSISARVIQEQNPNRRVRVIFDSMVGVQTIGEIETDSLAPPRPFNAHNSVTFDNSDIVTFSGVSSATISNFIVASNSDRLLTVHGAANVSPSPPTFTGWTWGADTITEQYDAVQQTFYRVGMASLVAPTAATRDITVTFSANADGAIAALSTYNVNQGTPHGSVTASNGASGTTVWAAVAGVADGMTVGFCDGSGTAITPVNGIAEYIAVGTATSSAGATGLTPTGAPAGRLVGDIEFCSIATENNETISCSGAGWTKLGSTVQQDSTWQEELWARLYTGTNVDPAFTWTSSVGCSARRWNFRDGAVNMTFGSHTTNSGATSTHSITGVNASANNALFMYLSHAEANTALAADAGYSERFDAGSATGPYRLVVGDREEATSGAGADNFSATGANASWVMRLLEIPAHSSGPQTHREEAENVAGDSMALATESGAAYNAFGWTMTGPGAGWHAIAYSISPAAAGGLSIPIAAMHHFKTMQEIG